MIHLQNCIEQPFESQYVRVARNNEFAEEFLFNIRVIFQSLDTRMSMYPIYMGMNSWIYNNVAESKLCSYNSQVVFKNESIYKKCVLETFGVNLWAEASCAT